MSYVISKNLQVYLKLITCASLRVYVWSCGRLTPHVWLGSMRPRSQCVGGMLLVQWCHKNVLNCLENLQLHLRLTCASQERTTSHPTRRWSRTGTRRRTDTSRCRGRAGGWRRRSEKQKQPVKRCPPEINVLLLWHSARDLPQCSEIRVWPVTATRCGGQAEARCAVTCSGLPPPYAFRSCGQSVCHSRFCLPRLASAPKPPGVPSADSPWIDL